ncbi:MAG TPA: MerR family transcriptional regulator [Lachnospiraceae bacterium]|nr:MerR family transcriptional regulator [Lachnospiraceae bacterium]
MNTLISITAICNKLHTTSRTLRYYEEAGLITSVRSGSNSPRQYSEEEVGKIRKILMLRSLDVPVLEIKELLEQKDLLSALLKRKRKLNQQIEKDNLILHKLKQVQKSAQMNAKNLSSDPTIDDSQSKEYEKIKDIATLVTSLFVIKDYHKIIDYFEDDKKSYLTEEYLRRFWEAVLIESGEVKEIKDIFLYNKDLVNVIVHCSFADILVKYYFTMDKLNALYIDTIEE